MSKIFVVMGKSATGKDTVYKKLKEDVNLNLKTAVIYTTRPIREGETEGVEYHFVSEAKLKELQRNNKVIEHRQYNTVHGIWHYFTVNDGQINIDKENYIMIGTLEAYEQIRNYYGKEVVIPIYIEVDDGIRLSRALDREKEQNSPKYAEMCRRFLADQDDFSEEKIKGLDINERFENLNLEDCLVNIKKYISRYQETYMI